MLFQKAQELENNSVPFVIVTLIDIRGSAPQELGAKCLVTKDGLQAGTVGGGKVEAHCINYAIDMIANNNLKPVIETWNLQKDIGMTCGGECTFMFEKICSTTWNIVIFGAGHVAQSLTRALGNIKCKITCIDSRKEWLDKLDQHQLNLSLIHHSSPKELVANYNKDTYFISMTQGHSHDTPIIAEIGLRFPNCRYVGVIGSRSKGNTIKAELNEHGCPQSFIDKLKVPIGLPIGTREPEEIAISIIAQLLQERDKA